ncbi:MAG TPA: TIGR00730 family Rossman fold protein [Limnochordia bacterium]
MFCASSSTVPRPYLDLARSFGTALGARGHCLVWGGGAVGMMGEVARAAQRAGARLIGVIPRALLAREVAFEGAEEMIVTETLRERKQRMDELCDAFVALPGGIGTLDELVEAIALKQLGYHAKPIAVLNSDGFFDPLLEQIGRQIGGRFAPDSLWRLFTVVGTPEAALEHIEQTLKSASDGASPSAEPPAAG